MLHADFYYFILSFVKHQKIVLIKRTGSTLLFYSNTRRLHNTVDVPVQSEGEGQNCLLRRSNPQVRACTSGLKIAADYTRMGNPTNLAMQTRGMRGSLAFMRLLSWLYLKMSCKQKCFSSKLCYFIPVPLVATFECSGRSLCVFIIKTESLHGTRGGFRPLQL